MVSGHCLFHWGQTATPFALYAPSGAPRGQGAKGGAPEGVRAGCAQGRGFLEGLGPFGPQPLQNSIPLSASPVWRKDLSTAERPLGKTLGGLRTGQGVRPEGRLLVALGESPPAISGGDPSESQMY